MQRKLRSAGADACLTSAGEVSLADRIIHAVCDWDGVSIRPHRFGGVEFRFGHAELGHLHCDGALDLRFPKTFRDRLIAKGWADIHHVLPASGWVTFRVEHPSDIPHAVR